MPGPRPWPSGRGWSGRAGRAHREGCPGSRAPREAERGDDLVGKSLRPVPAMRAFDIGTGLDPPADARSLPNEQ